MRTLIGDLRYASRVLRKRPAFSLAAIGTIALAIAANTAIFSLVNGVLLRPLRLPSPERLIRIEERHHGARLNLTGATFVDLGARVPALQSVAAYRLMSPGVMTGDAPQQVLAAEVSASYFDVLGGGIAAGRAFVPGDFSAAVPDSVIVSDALWRQMFGGNPGATGQRIMVNAQPKILVGITAAGLEAPGNPDIWMPRSDTSPLLRNRRAHLFMIIGRLARGTELDAARSQLEAAATSIARDSGDVDPQLSLEATPLAARATEAVRPALLMLWAAVALLLLIAAANIGNLLLMQATERTREFSIRSALGASSPRLVRQLATESLLLGALGGGGGTVAGIWAVSALRSALPATIPRVSSVTSDATSLVFGFALSIVASLLFAAAPAMRLAFRRSADTLRERTSTAGGARLRTTLIVAEVALTVVLLAGAALLGRSLTAVLGVTPGFDPSHVLSLSLSPLAARYPDSASQNRFYGEVLERMRAMPDVVNVAVSGAAPLSGTPATTMEPERTSSPDQLSANVVTASPGFFSVLRIPIVRGRAFGVEDRAGAPPVMIVNHAAARRFWSDGVDPIGLFITMKDWGQPYRAQVIGIAGDVRQAGLETEAPPAVYYPFAQFPESTLSHSILVRVSGDPAAAATAARAQLWNVDREQPIASIRPMETVLDGTLAQRRFNVTMVRAFSCAALLLAGVGIYGVIGFALAQRSREIGVRVACGARRVDIIRLAATQAFAPIAIGIAIGLPGAIAVAQSARQLLFEISPADPGSLAAVCTVIMVVGAIACAAPIRRAIRIDPATALRD